MAKVATTNLLLEEGSFTAGDELPASAVKYLDPSLYCNEKDFVAPVFTESKGVPVGEAPATAAIDLEQVPEEDRDYVGELLTRVEELETELNEAKEQIVSLEQQLSEEPEPDTGDGTEPAEPEATK